MKKYLIINLGRMGDVVETIPAMADLKQDSANHLTLMAAKPFVSLAYDIPILDDVIPVDLTDFMVQQNGENLLDRYRKLNEFAERLKAADYDVVLNFTHSKTSAALCHVLDVPDTRGVTLDKRGFQLVKNPWLFYFFVSNLNRPFNQFNLVDIYRRSIGCERSPGHFNYQPHHKGEREADELWRRHQIPNDRPIIGFAVGASNHTKRWLPEQFARLAEILHKTLQAHIIILGDKGDKKIAQEIIPGRESLISDLTMQTTLRGLGSVLKRCNLIVSNDTGTMHIAAAVGTPTISLVMGTALGSETAPYHTNGLVIQSLHHCAPCGYTNLCKDARCRYDITPEAVAHCVYALLSSSDAGEIRLFDRPDFSKIQVFRGDFDQDELFDLHPLIKRPLDPNSLTDRILRRIWLEFLENPPWDVLDNGGVERWVDRVVDYCLKHFELEDIGGLSTQYSSKDQAQLLKPLKWLDQGLQTADQLIEAARHKPLDMIKIKKLGDRLAEVDHHLESVGHTQQMLRAFHIYFNLRKGSLAMSDLEGQARETLDIYRGYKLQLLIADLMIESVLKKLALESDRGIIEGQASHDISIIPESSSDNKERINWMISPGLEGWEQTRRHLIQSMALKIPVPDQITSHQVRDRRLIIAPEKAAWIVTDAAGASALNLLTSGKSVGESIVELVETEDIPINPAIETVKSLAANITSQGFRSDIPSTETTLEARSPNLQIFLTRKCNLQCTHCYASAGQALQNELSAANWKQVIDDFSAMNAGSIVTFTGGEPLVHPAFLEIARHAKSAKNRVYLLTNGVAIASLDYAQTLVGTVDNVQLSLEGTVSETHDAIRGNGSFQRAINGLEHLLKAGIPVELVFVVLHSNASDLRDNLGDFLARFHNPSLTVALGVVNFIGRARCTMEDPAESLVGQVVDAYSDETWLRKGGWVSNRIVRGCPLANSVVVDADGRITTCPYLHYHSPYRIGQMPLPQAVNLDRTWHAQTIRQNPKCQQCDLRNFPCGGCMVLRSECSNQILERAYYRMVFGR